MHVLLAIALKSLLVAGLTLFLLAVMKKRSAAERSWVAHIGLFGLVVMALAPLALPSWNVEAPHFFASAYTTEVPAQTLAPSRSAQHSAIAAVSPTNVAPVPTAHPAINSAAAASAVYAIPAVILLLMTVLALVRLFALHARAEVLVDSQWVSALARAQRRMGFKHGTALLTSNELASPISWGLMRPVILLNTRAVEESGKAEAIIAHELAHVARMDWMKLLLGRVATALFWFNPFVWLLSREAHQLREEAADDAVLAADIADTDYAQLLVGVARHECAGLLLGAHGVAPSKSSLARRIARVLDGNSVRGPVARSFAVGAFVGAILIAAPLAALTFKPDGTSAKAPASLGSASASNAGFAAPAVAADLPHIIASGVSASVASAVAAVDPRVAAPDYLVRSPSGATVSGDGSDYYARSPSGATVSSRNGLVVTRAPSGATVTVYPPDASGRTKTVAVAPNGATAISYSDADDGDDTPSASHRGRGDSALNRAIEAKAVGVSEEYISAMRAVAPKLRNADLEDFVQLKAVGVSPGYVRELASVGLVNLDSDDLTQARAIGINSGFVRDIRGAGFGNADLEAITEAKAVGVTGDYIRRLRMNGFDGGLDDFVAMRAVGGATKPPQPPVPPRH